MTPRSRLAAGAAVACAVLPAVLALAGCGALGKLGGSAHYPAAKSFTISSRVTTLVIDGGSGSVDVTGANRSTVRVSEQALYSTKPPVPRQVLNGTTLTLSYGCATELSCSISYTIQVPRDVAVRASAGAGAITLTSLAGAATAQTSSGLITAVNLGSAEVSLKSDAGGIIATCSAAPRSLDASTKVGAIALTMPGSVAYKISTHTFVGTSTITVRNSARSAYAINASSDVGSISISPA
ncbi:MAG: hypothetical protein ABSA02_14460 [Trebonia sp.]|jgi:hypothetical protein